MSKKEITLDDYFNDLIYSELSYLNGSLEEFVYNILEDSYGALGVTEEIALDNIKKMQELIFDDKIIDYIENGGDYFKGSKAYQKVIHDELKEIYSSFNTVKDYIFMHLEELLDNYKESVRIKTNGVDSAYENFLEKFKIKSDESKVAVENNLNKFWDDLNEILEQTLERHKPVVEEKPSKPVYVQPEKYSVWDCLTSIHNMLYSPLIPDDNVISKLENLVTDFGKKWFKFPKNSSTMDAIYNYLLDKEEELSVLVDKPVTTLTSDEEVLLCRYHLLCDKLIKNVSKDFSKLKSLIQKYELMIPKSKINVIRNKYHTLVYIKNKNSDNNNPPTF